MRRRCLKPGSGASSVGRYPDVTRVLERRRCARASTDVRVMFATATSVAGASSSSTFDWRASTSPIGCYVLSSDASEDVPKTFLAARVGIGDELDSVGEVHFLEALREELEHLCARLLCALDGDGNRDPPDGVQRNALFNLSKNPSPDAYVASVDSPSNSSSRRRCSSVNWR